MSFSTLEMEVKIAFLCNRILCSAKVAFYMQGVWFIFQEMSVSFSKHSHKQLSRHLFYQ